MNYISNLVRNEGDPRIIQSGRIALSPYDRLAKALGWFSIGIGALELLGAGPVARILGKRGRERFLYAYGTREIGAGILSLSVDKEVGLWSRVAGDAVDLVTLAAWLREDDPHRENVRWAMALVAGVTALDILAAQGVRARHSRQPSKPKQYSDRSGFPHGLANARAAARNERTTTS